MAFVMDWVYGALSFLGLYQKSARILFLGLDNAGKTTLLHMLKDDRMAIHQPTIHPTMEELSIGNIKFRTFDLGGHEQARRVWADYFSTNVDAVVFLVDAAASFRFEESANELQSLLADEALAGVPFLILGNKVDIPEAVGEEELAYALGVEGQLTGKEPGVDTGGARPMEIFMVSVKLRQGLPHPKAFDRLVYYMVEGGRLLEVNAYLPYKDKACWFANDRVLTDGRLYTATPFDPYFLVLAVLDRAQGGSNTFASRDQLLRCDEVPALGALLASIPLDMGVLCEAKDSSSSSSSGRMWRLCSSKVVDWLESKAHALTRMLKDAGDAESDALTRVSAAAASGFVSSSRKGSKRKRDTDFADFATAIIQDYVSDAWASKLKSRVLGLADPETTTAAAADTALHPTKKTKPLSSTTSAGSTSAGSTSAGSGPVEDYSKAYKAVATGGNKELTTAQKKLKAAAKGTKQLSSFFGKA